MNDQLDIIPESEIEPLGPVSRAFIDGGTATVRAAFQDVWSLPYGRNDDPGDPLAPLIEGRGTCSTKHALLARLLDEQDIDCELRLGIYEMCETNTPGVGSTLAAHGLDAIPEAHCFLVVEGRRIDVTRVDSKGAEPIGSFLYEEAIEPEHIGEYKRTLHRRFIDAWAIENDGAPLTGAQLWAIREACIEALAAAAR